jgi:predicted nucleotidyltransferase
METMTLLNRACNHNNGGKRHRVAEDVATRLSRLPGVIAIALAGSTGVGVADERSDVDLEVYAKATIPLEQRAAIAAELADPAAPIEIGNDFWESGDEWTERGSGIALDILYRTPQWIEDQLDRVLVRHQASLGYTTCFWHGVSISHALYDPTGWYAYLQDHARIPYPEPLRRAILAKNYPVLRQIRSSYAHQIASAVARHDTVSINHRVAALLASYFDILFALNRVLHPGEKRLVEYAERTCAQRPEQMVNDVEALIQALGAADQAAVSRQVTTLLNRLDTLLQAEGIVLTRTSCPGQ